jgi:hypothetical protein
MGSTGSNLDLATYRGPASEASLALYKVSPNSLSVFAMPQRLGAILSMT